MGFGGLVTHEKALCQPGDSTHRGSREAAVTLWELGAALTGHQTPCSLSRRYLFPFPFSWRGVCAGDVGCRAGGKGCDRLGMVQPQHCWSNLCFSGYKMC